jgi:hypothetical protein
MIAEWKTGAGNHARGLPASASWDGSAAGKGPAERVMRFSGIEIIWRQFLKKKMAFTTYFTASMPRSSLNRFLMSPAHRSKDCFA